MVKTPLKEGKADEGKRIAGEVLKLSTGLFISGHTDSFQTYHIVQLRTSDTTRKVSTKYIMYLH